MPFQSLIGVFVFCGAIGIQPNHLSRFQSPIGVFVFCGNSPVASQSGQSVSIPDRGFCVLWLD